ncbi:MAG: 1-acyl-sn-glycerol-3-phosphate acyltransferase [Spirochaetales bacterium]|nr:1-acyl-sn-glycerol-3-phosphate acyltransferase [Spirochaetales bacterium]
MKTKDPLYIQKDLPPVENHFFYYYACIAKVFSYIFFITGSVLLGVIVFPFLKLFSKDKLTFRKRARKFVSGTFKFYISFLSALHLVKFSVEGKEKLLNLKSKIIVANHPSLLDIVTIISLIPNADCIVRGGLGKSIMKGVINQLYIVNNLGTEEMIERSKQSLEEGNCLVIFPEGTRTPPNGIIPYKRGAARIAIETKSTIVPVFIGGGKKYGLGKYENLFSYNHKGIYNYSLYVLDEIDSKDFSDLENQIAARRLTEKIHESISKSAFLHEGIVL